MEEGYGPWVLLGDLRGGALFENALGVRAVKSEYHLSGGQCQCILLASGEYAHFAGGNYEPVREIFIAY